tara:strand:- start:1319 stop:1462 length:144 start_codon:yes stop_codon:yes gene_type:complete
MDLIKEYRAYVEWCKGSDAHPIGFVPWKEKKFNATFNSKTGVWTRNK